MVRDRKFQFALRTDNSAGFVTLLCGKKYKKKNEYSQQYSEPFKLWLSFLSIPLIFMLVLVYFCAQLLFSASIRKMDFDLVLYISRGFAENYNELCLFGYLQFVAFVALPVPETFSRHPWKRDEHIRCDSFQSFFLTSLCCSRRATTVTTLIIRLD